MIEYITDLMKLYQKWMKEHIFKPRIENRELGRDWLYVPLEYNFELSEANYTAFFDRIKLNKEYATRYSNRDIPTKKPHAWYQNEINMIYGFHKCFAIRNLTRLEYYTHDLTQKGYRTKSALNQSIGKFLHLKEQAEKDNA